MKVEQLDGGVLDDEVLLRSIKIHFDPRRNGGCHELDKRHACGDDGGLGLLEDASDLGVHDTNSITNTDINLAEIVSPEHVFFIEPIFDNTERQLFCVIDAGENKHASESLEFTFVLFGSTISKCCEMIHASIVRSILRAHVNADENAGKKCIRTIDYIVSTSMLLLCSEFSDSDRACIRWDET